MLSVANALVLYHMPEEELLFDLCTQSVQSVIYLITVAMSSGALNVPMSSHSGCGGTFKNGKVTSPNLLQKLPFAPNGTDLQIHREMGGGIS